jgi:DNA repair protein RadC
VTNNKTRKKNSQPVYLREIQIKFKKKRVKRDSPVGQPVTNSRQVVKLFRDLQNETKEKLVIINLDSKNKILCFELVAIGNVDMVFTRPMEVFRTSIIMNAYSAIVLHNHPSGDPTPSEDDKKFTQSLERIAVDLGLRLLDHIVIGLDDYFSFADKGLL